MVMKLGGTGMRRAHFLVREGCVGIFNSIRGIVGLVGPWVGLLRTGLIVPVL